MSLTGIKLITIHTVFTRISAAALIKFFALQLRRLIEGGAYFKIGHYKEIFSYNLTVYLPSVQIVFSLSPSNSFDTFQWCLHSTQISLSPSKTSLFGGKTFPLRFYNLFYSGFYVIRNSSNKRHIGTATFI